MLATLQTPDLLVGLRYNFDLGICCEPTDVCAHCTMIELMCRISRKTVISPCLPGNQAQLGSGESPRTRLPEDSEDRVQLRERTCLY